MSGFALLIVLGTVGLVALLVTTLVAAGRTDVRASANLRDAATAGAAADGAIARGIFAVLSAQSVPSLVRVGEATVALRVGSEAGRINPNVAGAPLLRALLVELGLAPGRAGPLAAAIVDWRTPGSTGSEGGDKQAGYARAGLDYAPPGGPYRDLGELRLVLGMTDDVARALAPHLTLWWQAEPDPAAADPVVARAIADVSQGRRQGGAGQDRVLSFFARATLPRGGAATRHAVVRFSPYADGRDFRVLAQDAQAE